MEIEFKDIENIIRLHAHFVVFGKYSSVEQKTEFDAVGEAAMESLWKIRRELMLDGDVGLTLEEFRAHRKKKEYIQSRVEKWEALDEEISKFYENEDSEGDLCEIGEIAASAFGYL